MGRNTQRPAPTVVQVQLDTRITKPHEYMRQVTPPFLTQSYLNIIRILARTPLELRKLLMTMVRVGDLPSTSRRLRKHYSGVLSGMRMLNEFLMI